MSELCPHGIGELLLVRNKKCFLHHMCDLFALICFRCDMEEKKDEEESTMNEGEADVAIAHAKRLIQSGVQASDIGIITPYAAQVSKTPEYIKSDRGFLHYTNTLVE